MLSQVGTAVDDNDPAPTVTVNVQEGQQLTINADSQALSTAEAISDFEDTASAAACDGMVGTCDVTVSDVTTARRRRMIDDLHRQLSESTAVSAQLTIWRASAALDPGTPLNPIASPTRRH